MRIRNLKIVQVLKAFLLFVASQKEDGIAKIYLNKAEARSRDRGEADTPQPGF
jgi:hypothetical protein